MSNTNDKLKRQRARLFLAQDGKCLYCGCDMVLMMRAPPKFKPPNLCTLEHLRARTDPTRRAPLAHGHDIRRAVACLECNNREGARTEAALPLRELHERAGRHPSRCEG